MVASTPSGELSLATMRPKGNLTLRLMFEGGRTVLTILGAVFALVGVGTVFLAADPGRCVLLREKWMRCFHTT